MSKNHRFNEFIKKHFPDYLDAMARSLHELSSVDYPSTEKAHEVIQKYRHVMEKIGWRWLPEEYARRLHDIIKEGVSPEEWLAKVMHYKKSPGSFNDTFGASDLNSDVNTKELDIEKPNSPMTIQELSQVVKQLQQEIKGRETAARQKPYIVVSPSGEVHKIRNTPYGPMRTKVSPKIAAEVGGRIIEQAEKKPHTRARLFLKSSNSDSN